MSLAVLGLIAGLTVPSIVASVENSKNRTILKEDYQIITSILSAGVLNGDFSNITDWSTTGVGANSIVNYIGSKLNYTKQCLAGDLTSAGCLPLNGAEYMGLEGNAYNNHSGRWVMPNGSRIQFGQYVNQGSYIQFIVTTNASTAKIRLETRNDNGYFLACNPTDQVQIFNNNTKRVQPGSCSGWDLARDGAFNRALGLT